MASADGRTGRGAVDALVRVRTAGRAAHAAVSATATGASLATGATGTALASLSAVRTLAALATVRTLASLASFGVRATALATGRSRSAWNAGCSRRAWRVRNGNVRRGLRCGRDGGQAGTGLVPIRFRRGVHDLARTGTVHSIRRR